MGDGASSIGNTIGGSGITNRRSNDGQGGREALLAAAERRARDQSNT